MKTLLVDVRGGETKGHIINHFASSTHISQGFNKVVGGISKRHFFDPECSLSLPLYYEPKETPMIA